VLINFVNASHILLAFCGSGKKNKLRVYYLSWLRNKILRNDPEVEKKIGYASIGDLEGCTQYKVVKYGGFCIEVARSFCCCLCMLYMNLKLDAG